LLASVSVPSYKIIKKYYPFETPQKRRKKIIHMYSDLVLLTDANNNNNNHEGVNADF